MRARLWTRVAGVAALSALAAQLPLTPASRARLRAQAPAATTPTFRTDASYVRVDVFATADGRPVTDLRADDLEVFEDGQRQAIAQFEYVNIRVAAPDVLLQEPATVAESRAPVINQRSRVLILFLDSAHVDIASSARIREPLMTMLRGMLIESDLVAVMTPDMSARDLAFTHKAQLFANVLDRHPFWGEIDRPRPVDAAEEQFRRCYPGLAQELIERRRAKRTFDSLKELVGRLRDVREERKAVIAVSGGWRLRRADDRINEQAERLSPPAPLTPFDAGGRPVTEATGGATTADVCAPARMELSGIDFEREFRDIVAMANRANTSFYPVDPGGLRPDMDSSRGAPPIEQGGNRFESGNPASTLRELASDTDGKAILGTNLLTNVLREALADASSYYLLGYQSTGKLDGKFHAISVRSRRPGISIRARKGYVSTVATRPAPAVAPAVAPAADAMAVGMRAALERLTSAARDLPARASIVAGWSQRSGTPVVHFTIVGEVRDRARAASMDVTIARESGEPVGTGRTELPAGTGAATLTVAAATSALPGPYVVRVRIDSNSGSDTLTIPIQVGDRPDGTGALYIRRRGNQDVPTADLRFRRTEQMSVTIPGTAEGATARLLDRNGNALNATLEPTGRMAEEGSPWIVVRPSLASLAPGDYLVEIASSRQRVLVPFRIIP